MTLGEHEPAVTANVASSQRAALTSVGEIMTSDPNMQPPQQPQSGHYQRPPYQDPAHSYSPHYAGPQQQHPLGQDNLPPQPPVSFQSRKGPFGASFWIVAAILSLLVITNTLNGNGEGILIILGLAAALTGLIAMGSERRTWANLPNRKISKAVCLTGVASLLVGSVAAGVDASNTAHAVAAAAPATSAELEEEAAAELQVREEALVASEGESAAKLKVREDAVAAREAAAGTLAVQTAGNTIGQGVWTVGRDMPPGTYRTTKAVHPDSAPGQ